MAYLVKLLTLDLFPLSINLYNPAQGLNSQIPDRRTTALIRYVIVQWNNSESRTKNLKLSFINKNHIITVGELF